MKRDDAVFCVGTNEKSELGVPSQLDLLPTRVGSFGDAAHVSIGGGGACASMRAGAVFCWGKLLDTYGSTFPVTRIEGIADATAVAFGFGQGCAVRRSGGVACWGETGLNDDHGRSEQERLRSIAVPGITDAASVSVAGSVACVVRRTGRVSCWGRLTSAGPEPAVDVPGLVDATQVHLQSSTGCALRRSGNVALFAIYSDDKPKLAPHDVGGLDQVAQLGDCETNGPGLRSGIAVIKKDGRAENVALVEASPRGGWRAGSAEQIAASAAQTTDDCVLSPAGGVTCKSQAFVAWRAPIDDATEISAYIGTTCAVRRSGEVTCWGRNGDGQIGVKAVPSSEEPVQVPLP